MVRTRVGSSWCARAWRRYIVPCSFALVVGAARAAAQNPLRLSGFVADATTSRRLADATLEVVGESLQRIVRTDKQGEFTALLPAGSYRVTTHRVGYQIAVTRLRMPGADSSVAILLTPIAVALAVST